MTQLTHRERDSLLSEMERLTYEMYGPRGNELSTEALRTLKKKRDDLMARYLTGLPMIRVGRCPYCGVIVTNSIDTFGMDSPWWDVLGKALPPKACAHFFVMLGAMNFHGKIPKEAAPDTIDEIRPGPEVPYIIPRLMEIPGMKCIIFSQRIIEDKYTTYFITYFADPPAPPEQGHQPWLRSQFTYVDEKGHAFWNIQNDVWDFDIERWLMQTPNRVGWIHPEDPDMKIVWASPSECPYINVQGRRKPLSIKRGRIYELPLPDGTPFGADIFE